MVRALIFNFRHYSSTEGSTVSILMTGDCSPVADLYTAVRHLELGLGQLAIV